MSQLTMANASRLTKPEDGTQGKLYTYLCYGHPMDECLKKDFFRSLYGNFFPGDRIQILEFGNKTNDPRHDLLKGMCECIVVSVANQTADVRLLEWTVQHFDNVPVEKVVEEPVEPFEEFIQDENAKAQWFVGNRTWRVMVEDHVVAEVKDKDLAFAIARGDAPLPPLKVEV